MLLPNSKSVHTELVFRLQIAVFPTIDPSRPIRQQHPKRVKSNVFNVQEDKHIQILITKWMSGQEEIREKLEDGNAQVLEKVIAKPNVNQAYFEISGE